MDMPLAITNPATERQISFIRSLVDKKYTTEERVRYVEFLDTAVISKARASEIITLLKTLPNVFVEEREELAVGMYRVDGVTYKVQMSQGYYGGSAGHLYAKRWNEASESFEKESGAIRKIRASHRMTLEEAESFGQVTGVCGHCGRTLTDEDSIARGIGPVCATKY